MLVLKNGEPHPDATVHIADAGFVRGDGCFEALRVYAGLAFAVDEHVNRLAVSAEMVGLTLPALADIATWVHRAAATLDQGVIRVLATPGGPDQQSVPPTVFVVCEPVPERPSTVRLLPTPAPWHAAGRSWGLAGAKTLSYGPNVHATRLAKQADFDDALLISDDGIVLEGPTFSVGWFKDGVLETPSLDLLILDSITRRHVLPLAERLREGTFDLAALASADEVFAVSTIKEVTPVTKVGEWDFAAGPLTKDLQVRFMSQLSESGFAV